VPWRTQLNTPAGSLDGGIPLGILGTRKSNAALRDLDRVALAFRAGEDRLG
jgi:hypothetical protein